MRWISKAQFPYGLGYNLHKHFTAKKTPVYKKATLVLILLKNLSPGGHHLVLSEVKYKNNDCRILYYIL